MATKSISIDLEPYDILERCKRDDESFSAVLERVVPRPVDLDRRFAEIERKPPSKEAVEAIEEHIEARSRPSRRKR